MAYFRNYNINHLDKIAYSILAVSYSGVYRDGIYENGTHAQDYIGVPCVATAFCGVGLLVAANNIWRSDGPGHYYHEDEVERNVNNNNIFWMIIQFLRSEGINERVIFLRNPPGESDTSYHAELQLVDYITENNYILTRVGVSKPCCTVCTSDLRRRGIAITASHYNDTNAERPSEPRERITSYRLT